MAIATLRAAEYRELYKDLNQVSESLILEMVEFSEVMVIHRMYLKMGELDVGHLEGAERVKHLYVFADVVEMAPTTVRLPGSVSISIVCRLLWIPLQVSNIPLIAFPHLKLRVNFASGSGNRQYDVYRRTDSGSVIDEGLALCIHAADIQLTGVGAFAVNSPAFYLFSNPRFAITEGAITFGHPDSQVPVLMFRLYADALHLLRVERGIIRIPHPFSNNLRVATTVHCPPAVIMLTLDTNQPLAPGFSILKGMPNSLLKADQLVLFMQMSLLIAELAELAHPSSETRDAVLEHVEWLSDVLIDGASSTEGTQMHQEYLALSFRAQYLLKTASSSRSLVVPQLQYDLYSPLINRMAQVAQIYDDTLSQFKLFILQNRILGSYLLEQNKASAEREKDLEIFHAELISQLTIELNSTLLKMDQLSVQMEIQTSDMEQAEREMEEGLRRFRNRQVARAMFSVIRAIGAVALTVVTGGAAAPAAMSTAKNAVTLAGQAARGLQSVLEILEGLQAVMEVVAIIKELMESLQDVGKLVEGPDMPEMPTDADWAIFVNEVEAVAAEMPEEVSEVVTWKTKCKNVAALGRELMTTAAYISRLQYDIKEHAMLQEIAKRHANRLANTQAANLSSYTEMVIQMEMRTMRIIISLVKVVYMQNAALMYEYLTQPTQMRQTWPVSMETVWRMLIQREHASILGLIRLGPSFDFKRIYVVRDIPVSLLLTGEDWEFEIPVSDHTTFPSSWTRVRIKHLEMKFVDDDGSTSTAAARHQPITDTGNVYILLQGSRAFHDRDQAGRLPLSYEAALPLDYHYAYRLDTGETTLSNLPTAQFINSYMRMTPFTNWRLRLSASALENQGLDFPTARQEGAINQDATTQIAITFHVSAIRQISF